MNKKVREKLENSWAPVFYEHIFCNIDESVFAPFYGATGNPNFPVNILLSLEYIKHMKGLTDAELMGSFYFDYLVNYAVGLRTLGERHLSERTLYNFRKRIYNYCKDNPDEEGPLFSQFITLLKVFAEKAGVGMDEQRMDTTMFMSNIKKSGRITLVFDVLVQSVKAIPENLLTENLANVLMPGFKTDILFKAKTSENETKLIQLLNLCKEALDILSTLSGEEVSKEVRILKRLIKE